MATKAIAAALKKIEDRAGRLTPTVVLEAARKIGHPLHSHFEWDDSVAAERWRVEQARELIRSVKVFITVNHIPVPVVCYVRDPEANEANTQGYRAITSLPRGSGEARDAVVAEFVRAASHLRRARDIASALGFAAEIEEMLNDIVELGAAVKSGRPTKCGTAKRGTARGAHPN